MTSTLITTKIVQYQTEGQNKFVWFEPNWNIIYKTKIYGQNQSTRINK